MGVLAPLANSDLTLGSFGQNWCYNKSLLCKASESQEKKCLSSLGTAQSQHQIGIIQAEKKMILMGRYNPGMKRGIVNGKAAF